MTIIQAILEVMHNAGHPLTVKQTYDQIVDGGLYSFKAQNPQHVVQSQLRRHCDGLDFPTAKDTKYFKLEDDGRFSPLSKPIRLPQRRKQTKSQAHRAQPQAITSLSSTFAEIRKLQETYRQQLKAQILTELKSFTPAAFEHFSKKLLDVYGFEDVKVTEISNDGGIDGFGKLRVGLAHMRVAFQCKRWTKTNIGRPEIDRFRGAIQGDYEQGIFFTTAGFVPAAKNASIRAGAVPVILVDGPSMVELMIDKQFGVEEEQISIHTYALDTILDDNTE